MIIPLIISCLLRHQIDLTTEFYGAQNDRPPIRAMASISDEVRIQVDRRLEVLDIISWLAGKYPAPADSAYKLRAWNHFKRFRTHPAVLAIKNAKSMYTDFSSLGVDIVDWPNARFNASPDVIHWQALIGDEQFSEFKRTFPDFIKKSRFDEFFNQNQAEFAEGVNQFEKILTDEKVISDMESFYRYGKSRPSPRFEIFLEPLNAWGAHAIVDQSKPAGQSSAPVRYQLGFWGSEDSNLDSKLQVGSIGGTRDTAWHEGSHVYIASIFYAHQADYAKNERLFNKDMLASQSINTWEYCLNENIVRAITAVLIKLNIGDREYRKEVDNQVNRSGFIYTGKISKWILDEYVGNNAYRDFDDYFPTLISHLDGIPSFVKS